VVGYARIIKANHSGRDKPTKSPVLFFRGLLLIPILTLLAPPAIFPQTKDQFYSDPKADAIIRHGLHLSYNLEYSLSEKDWDDLIHLYPEHPAGYVNKAALVWWQAVENRQNKQLQEQFATLTKKAIDKGMVWLQKSPRDKFALAYVASAYGNATRFDVTVTRSYFSALRNGKKGHKYIDLAHAVDPNYYDTYIGLGSYNYFTGALPSVIKPFAWLLGARGDKDQGIHQLLLASEKGEYGRTEARIVLLSVYFSERRWDEYERLLDTLLEEYPLNHVFYTWASNYYIGMRRWDLAISEFRKVEKLIDPNGSPYGPGALAWLNFNLGRNYFAKQDWIHTVAVLDQAEKLDPGNPVLLAQLYLLKGNALDKLGRRPDAVAAYQRALQYPSIEDSYAKSKRYLKSAYGE